MLHPPVCLSVVGLKFIHQLCHCSQLACWVQLTRSILLSVFGDRLAVIPASNLFTVLRRIGSKNFISEYFIAGMARLMQLWLPAREQSLRRTRMSMGTSLEWSPSPASQSM